MADVFGVQKKRALQNLEAAKREKDSDEGIMNLVNFINDQKGLYTTSSCSGRIVLMQTPAEHDKQESKFLGKWHHEIHFEQMYDALQEHDKHMVYLKVECPILHIMARDAATAERVVELARESGFKRSGIQSIKPDRVMIEVCSTENMEVPIAENRQVLVEGEYLEYLVKIANMKWGEGQKKLERLEKAFHDSFKL